jgi:DnaJ-class molecular chaperone
MYCDVFVDFVAIGNAVAILTDPEKRKQYDLYGSNDERSSFQRHNHTHRYQEYTRGFEGTKIWISIAS